MQTTIIARPFKRGDLSVLAIGLMLPDIIVKPPWDLLIRHDGPWKDLRSHLDLFACPGFLASSAIPIQDIRPALLGAGVLI